MIRDSLMNRADEVRRIGVGEGETEFSLGIGLGVADLLHAGGKFDEDDFVAYGWLVAGAVGDGAFQRGSKQRRRAREQQKCHGGAQVSPDRQTRCPFLFRITPAGCTADSNREISARIAAASSSRELFIVR